VVSPGKIDPCFNPVDRLPLVIQKQQTVPNPCEANGFYLEAPLIRGLDHLPQDAQGTTHYPLGVLGRAIGNIRPIALRYFSDYSVFY